MFTYHRLYCLYYFFMNLFRKHVLETNGGQKIYKPNDENEVKYILTRESFFVKKKAEVFFKREGLTEKDILEIVDMEIPVFEVLTVKFTKSDPVRNCAFCGKYRGNQLK
jgi:hypothetical protein